MAGITQETADKLGISLITLYNRVKTYGWTVEEATTTPRLRKKRSLYRDYEEIAIQNGICKDTFNYRVRNGMTPLEAVTKPKKGRFKRKIPIEYIEKAEQNGICLNTFKSRVYSLHWSYEDAATRPIRKGWKK